MEKRKDGKIVDILQEKKPLDFSKRRERERLAQVEKERVICGYM